MDQKVTAVTAVLATILLSCERSEGRESIRNQNCQAFGEAVEAKAKHTDAGCFAWNGQFWVSRRNWPGVRGCLKY